MKKGFLISWLLLMSGLCFSQANQSNGGGTGSGVCIATVATLSSACGTTNGKLATVTDGNSATDCLVGGGTAVVACKYGPSAWAYAGSAASLPTAATQGQVPAATGAGTTYAAQNKPLLDTRDDAGGNTCLRIQDQAVNGKTQTISAEGEVSNAVSNCGPQDFNPNLTALAAGTTFRYKLRCNGSTQLQTDIGFTQGAFQQLECQIADVSGITANVNTSGFVLKASSIFPGNCTLTATGVTGNLFVTLIQSGGVGCTEALNLSPGVRLTNGDSVVGGYYYISKCTGTAAPCVSNGPLVGSDWSQFYTLPTNSSIVVNIEPPLATTFTGTSMTLMQPIHEIGDVIAHNTGQTGISDTDSWLQGAEIFGGVLAGGQCIGVFSLFGQENSRYRDIAVNSCGIGAVFAGGDNGSFDNVNVGYGSNAKCPTHTNPMELWSGAYEVTRVTINGNNCDAVKEDSGLIDITNNPVNQTGGGVLHLHDSVHMEGSGTGAGGTVAANCPNPVANQTCNGIFLNTLHTTALGYPLANQTTGQVEINDVIGCPPAFPCTNLLDISAGFIGTLNFHDSSCNNAAAGFNAVYDEINANIMQCQNNVRGITSYMLMQDGTAFTTMNCADMTKGWCLTGTTWFYYLNGKRQNSVPLTSGTSAIMVAPAGMFVCTSTCTVTLPVPVAGYQFCVYNGDNVATVITLAALGTSARYENTARTAYGTAGTGTFVSGGAVKDSVCVVGLDATHYITSNFNGTWTAN